MSSTTSQSSTLIDDDLSLMVQDASETTVATQTSRSWHSVRSDLPMNNHLFIRSPTINHWLTRCSIEPDIRLTTAQEWKLRTCLRRFLLLCNHQLHFISESPLSIEKESKNLLECWNLCLHLSAGNDDRSTSLDVTLIELDRSSKSKPTLLPLIKPIRLVFYVLSNVLKLSLRSERVLVELSLITRESEPIRGTFYRWNENDSTDERYPFTVQID